MGRAWSVRDEAPGSFLVSAKPPGKHAIPTVHSSFECPRRWVGACRVVVVVVVVCLVGWGLKRRGGREASSRRMISTGHLSPGVSACQPALHASPFMCSRCEHFPTSFVPCKCALVLLWGSASVLIGQCPITDLPHPFGSRFVLSSHHHITPSKQHSTTTPNEKIPRTRAFRDPPPHPPTHPPHLTAHITWAWSRP